MPTSLRNQGWENQNESRAYPLDDGASAIDDNGNQLPAVLIADLKALVPETAGKYLYIGAVTATPVIVTVIILATDDLDVAGQPVLTISQKTPVVFHKQYDMSAQIPGAGGWITFGEGIGATRYSGRFSTARQSLLAPLAARWYRTPRIPSVGKLGSPGLTGLVKLVGGNDIEIVNECREVPGHPVPSFETAYCIPDDFGTTSRNVVVFRLKNKAPSQQNVFAQYVGPCGNRPESKTCGDPEPIEFIGPVTPDCCGNITIEFRGCAQISAVQQLVTVDEHGAAILTQDACGIVVDCGLGLADACVSQAKLPDADGNLPDEPLDLCASLSFDSVSPGPDSLSDSFAFDSVDAGAGADPDLPIVDHFTTLEDYAVQTGVFAYDGDNAVLMTDNSASRNVVTYEPAGGAPTGYFRRVSSTITLLPGVTGALHNAAVLANYNLRDDGHFGYFAAEIDWDGHYRGFKLFRLAEFNGSQWVNLFAVPVPELELNQQYDILMEVYPHADQPNGAWLVARLVSVTGTPIDLEIGPLAVAHYGPADGPFGLGTNQAESTFSNLTIENIV